MLTPSIPAHLGFSAAQTVSTKIYNYGYFPLIKGDIAPVFQFNKEAFVSVQHYLDLQQPLVVVFIEGSKINEQAFQPLLQLQANVQQAGGNLVVVSNVTSRSFRKNVSQINNLTLFFDEHNLIAEQFGLYDEGNPLSNWLSGIENDEAILPAIYVVAPNRQIVYTHVDYQFNLFSAQQLSKTIEQQLMEAVTALSETYSYLSVWRNQLVS